MEIRLLLPHLILCLSATAGGREFLSLGSGDSLSPEEVEDVPVSPKRTFSGGFHEVGTNAYCFSVWFTSSVDKTVVWMANRDSPVNGRLSTVRLEKRGNLVLKDADGSRVWETAASLPAATSVELSETGNLVLLNQTRGVIWESFASPTDTLLPLQPLTKGNKLVSRSGPGSYSSGYYSLRFSDDNVLKMVYDAPKVTSVYWPKPDKDSKGSWSPRSKRGPRWTRSSSPEKAEPPPPWRRRRWSGKRGSKSRWGLPKGWPTSTTSALSGSSTATSSRRTSSWTGTSGQRSPTSGWPSFCRGAPLTAISLQSGGPRVTWHRNGSSTSPSPPKSTSTATAWCCWRSSWGGSRTYRLGRKKT
ncbi:unnamed protein product [Spirodela intermedia]|uniref:Bulb-type lectin domain-containing protein n=1 Tax=Spirodela intermedia TaxID=51605 RepID=A0A7I8K1W4_SPIIN|nr:unnamed protein product [Spirodela intermedia]